MLSPEKIEDINDTLLKRFGYLHNRPKYRLVWSNSMYEYRYVEGYEFVEGTNVKLRDIKAIKSMPKYPRDRNRYILEILTLIPEKLKHELHGEGNGLTYEPLWVFKKVTRALIIGNMDQEDYQEPVEHFIYILASLSHYPIETVISPEFELWKMDKIKYAECMDILDDALPDLGAKIRAGSATFIDSTKRLS